MFVMQAVIAMARPVEETADQRLVARVLAGDDDAYGEIISRHQRKIYKTALAIVRDEAEADVITHDSFVQAYLKLSKFEGRAELETWLTRIAINKARDVLRKRRWISLSGGTDGEDDRSVIEVVDERPDAERNASSNELATAIDRAVETLSAQQKLIFRMRHFEERPLEEIATLLGVRPGTVRAHLFRAVHKVREQLAPWWSRAAGGNAGEEESS